MTATKTRARQAQLRIDHEAWKTAITRAAGILPSRPAVPVLACLRLQYLAGNLEVSAFDYDQSARVIIGAAGDDFPEDPILLSGPRLAAVTSKMLAEPVTLTLLSEDKAEIRCGPITYTMPVMPSGDYPLLPALPESAGTVDGELLTVAIRAATMACSNDDTLPALSGVATEFSKDELILAATDRYRMVYVRVPWERDPGIVTDPEIILIPADAYTTIIRDKPTGPVALHYGDDSQGQIAGYTTATTTLTSRLIGDQMPNLRKQIDRYVKDMHWQVELLPGPVIEAIDRVAAILGGKETIRLIFTPGFLTVAARGGEFGAGEETMAVDTTSLLGADGTEFDGEVEMLFNPGYLRDGLAGMAGASTVTLRYPGSGAKPVLFTGDHDGLEFEYLVVPIHKVGDPS